MTDIKKQISELRTWFINNPTPNDQVKNNYLKLLDLLQEGEVQKLKIGTITCGALHEFLFKNMSRINKIDRPDEVICAEEPKATAEQLYALVRQIVQIQLADV